MIAEVLCIELHVANIIHIAAMKYCGSKTEIPQHDRRKWA
jgi:hypothetical protein